MLPGTPASWESSTARVAKVLAVFVCQVRPMFPSKTRWASQTVRVLALAGGECAIQTWWKLSIWVMLQPWVVFATGSAVIHLTYTSPVSGSTSIPLGTVLQKDWVSAMPFCARTSTEGPKVCPPSFEAVTLIWLAEKSWYDPDNLFRLNQNIRPQKRSATLGTEV